MADVEVSNTLGAEKDRFDVKDVDDDDVGQNKTKLIDNNHKEEMEQEKNDTELLNKIDEAIGLPFQSNGDSIEKEIDIGQMESDELLKESEILNGDELLDTIIDEKTEDELLNSDGEEQEQVLPSVENEFIELFNSVATLKESNDKVFDSLCEEKKSVENQDETGLLDECESPKEAHHDDDTSNGNGSNDEDSNQNGESELENENSEKESSNEDDGGGQKDEQEEISAPATATTDEQENENKLIKIDEVNGKSDDEEKSDELEKNTDAIIIKDVVSTASEVLLEAPPTESPEEVSNNKMEVNEEPASPQQLNDSGDIEMAESEKDVKNEEFLTKEEIPSIEDLQRPEDDKKEAESETESNELIKQEEISSENDVPVQRVKFNFMRNFTTHFGKFSHEELEELLLQKITESLVYRSQCAELRTKYEEQEETIERLQKRLSVVTKQYNDLDMIHKRVEKDLKERPDQPIQPVRITRAVGLQVFLEPKNTAYNNSGNIGGNANSITRPTKQYSSSATTPTLAASILNHKNPASIKRLIDANIKINCEPEAKRKKSGKITPLRPSLTEKEEISIKMQEATIEQHIRAKINKVTPPVIKYPSTVSTVATNGIASKPPPKQTHSSTSIDLTDDIDDTPSKANPPALVAIQRGSNNLQQHHPRALLNKSSLRSPNVAYRSETFKNIIPIHKHPAPLPLTPPQVVLPSTKKIPPRPNIKINNVENGIIVSWTVDGLTAEHAEIQCYQIYAYEETKSAPSTENWKHVGDVKALLLPMAVTLTQFQEGQKYFFAVRAMDTNKRLGQFSLPKTWAHNN